MPSALAAREKGVPLVNIAQPFKQSGMMLICREGDRHHDAGRLQGQDARRLVLRQRISVPRLDEQARPADRRRRRRRHRAQAGLQRRAADPEAGRLHLDHDLQRVLAGDRRRHQAEELVVFKYEDQGVATLEDGLYVLEDKLKDPAFVDKMARFVQGLDEGLGICPRAIRTRRPRSSSTTTTGAQTEAHQNHMMGEIAKLTAGAQRRPRRGRPTTARSSRLLSATRRSSPRSRQAPGPHASPRRRGLCS